MHCAVASLPSSPMFTPSPRNLSPICCKTATSPPPPPPASPSLFANNNTKHIRKLLNRGDDGDLGSSKVPPMLKRKRPMRIDVPVASVGFEDVKAKSDVDSSNWMEFEGEGYSVYCKRGKRRGDMEDRYSAAVGLQGDSKQAFFAVFDGHGGAGAAEFAAKNLEKNVMKEVSKQSSEIANAVKQGYLTTDSDFLKEDIQGGTCCVTAVVCKGDLAVSNAGDCRAVMSRGGVAEALTVDHRPSLEDERERIESLGGYVDCCHGFWRVHGSLAVSRAIGDRHLKQWVIAEPTTKVFKIRPECEFLILASDGLWDNVGNQEAVDVVRSHCVDVDRPEPFSACKKLMDLALTRGSLDDISIMVIQLTQFIS
ncbi:probable protein phosphatase 2C 25 [Andrographis paniculata]|uniref:probable protein phosphatase 2C 25 n=1 Tax=Andrographis paniculata TaxID=175694 RepID=UPI0021E78616|nr:probable protein phosphatase 2C 25 [Andrographis paniculata]